ncbi:hypothetical protein ACIO1C_13130 [Streptomyces sp. NPDC087420]|uniref:hypothetical protein n=1 Tax=Streptomyces sp. NPDC087420 TaxID=3365785 RepID=UPI003837AF17
MYAVPAQADEPGDNPTDPWLRTTRISLGAAARGDRCEVARYVSFGGAEMKATAGKALAGTDADLVTALRTSVDGWAPVIQATDRDKAADGTYAQQYETRHTNLDKANKPYAPENSEEGRDYFAPDFGADILDFTFGKQREIYNRASDSPTPKAGSAAFAKAKQVFATETGEPLPTFEENYKSFAGIELLGYSGDTVAPGSANDIASFLRFGGFPRTAPEPDSLEFRSEVESLKIAWASCDSDNPIDYNRVLTGVVTQAYTEWESEYAAQSKPRADIVAAEITASKEVRTATAAMIEAVSQAWLADQILFWQKYWAARPGDLLYPKAAEFTKATADLAAARKAAAAQVTIADKAAAAAKVASDKAAVAQSAGYAVADAAGTPRGRGLLYAQQAVQVAKASTAAATAASKATLTASNAAKATAAGSGALYALSQTQSHAVNTEFRKAAALEAAAQARAAATAAETQAKEAAANATRAKNAQGTAERAEQTARTAAATAKSERAKAEAEKANATRERTTAESERNKAAAAEQRAVNEREAAGRASGSAQTAGSTAAAELEKAENAEFRAASLRDDAVAAERDKNATASRAAALEAAAAAAEGTASAGAARQAATEARTAANEASGAATRARTAANDATSAAVNARAAATRAGGAASRARASSDRAWSAYQTSYAAAQTSHAAAAEAIDASDAAARNAKAAEAESKKAQAASAEAHRQALAAKDEAAQTSSWAAKTAGFAYAAGQSAAAAGAAATEVVKPANEAISIGSPYKETDAAAAFAVLVGQTSLTMAQQQAAAAQAKSEEAARAAATAKALADKANADAKAAANAAAAAAADAAKALASVAAAKASAAEAAKAAAAAKKADVNTTAYNAQAGEDALFAASAANGAESEASAAGAAATEAEKDAAGARGAATAAEADASTARATATRAETDATAAETAATNADQSAREADTAADRAEEEARKALEEDRKAAMAQGGTGVSGGSGPGLGGDDEAVLRAGCGQACVDQYRAAMGASNADVVDWLKANSGEVLLELIGIADLRRCFGQGDIESCLWTLVNAVSVVVLIGKIPAVTKAVVTVTRGIGAFFEAAETGKKLVAQYKFLVKWIRKAPDCVTDQVRSASGPRAVAPSGTAARPAASAALGPRCEFISGPIPESFEIDRGSLVKISDSQLKKALATIGEDAHSFKQEIGGSVAHWDNFREKATGRIIFVRKGGKVLIPTAVRFIP